MNLSASPLHMSPIESCPRDGTRVLLRAPSGYMGTDSRFDEGYYEADYPRAPWRNHSHDAWDEGGELPTHWAPLPTFDE